MPTDEPIGDPAADRAHPEVDADRVRARQVAPAELDALFGRLEAEISAPPSLRARAAALSTPARSAAAVGITLAVGALMVAVQGLRPDLGAAPWRLALAVALLSVAGVRGLLHALRPMHRSPPNTRWLTVLRLVVIGLLFSLVGLMPGMTEPPDPVLPVHLHCLAATLIGGMAVSLGVLAFDRGYGAARWRLGVAGAAAGLAAFAFQSLCCPLVELTHLVVSHASAGALCVALLLALHGAGRALRSDP